jgi:hypothetical protein
LDKDKALKLLDKYIAACEKRCEKADVSLGDRRRGRIRSACRNRVLAESGLDGMKRLNLAYVLYYAPKLGDMIPDGIKLYNMIPKEQDPIWHQPTVIPFKQGEEGE